MATADDAMLIIGAGIAGASLAWRLARAGRPVVLIEREPQPGMHSTGRSAAMFMESYGPPGVRALTRASRDFYLHPPAGFAEAPLLSPRHALFVATAGQQAALARMQADLAASGTTMVLLNSELLAQAAPALKPDLFQNALLDEQGYDMDVHALLQGFLRGARQAGARLLTGVWPLRAAHDGQRWRVALSDGNELVAHTVVNAAGAWADELAALFGAAPIGLQPRRRSAFTFRAPEGVDIGGWPMVADVDEAWYFKPDAGQLLGSPANADPVPPHDVQPEEFDIALGIHLIQEATSLRIERPTATWAGLRSFVADGDLVIGFDDACPGFFWLAAQGGYGIQSAAGASLLAASLIAGQPLPAELAAHGVEPRVVSPLRLRGATPDSG
ncbi:MAG TPA: FAD-binding oxidoreductase [Ottowia sp.]|nr:MAG: FAD-dependent oxidoreductase [Burkholderiales bacterium 68-10]HMT82010.1 FAD-binding oxidoreductase [Ottowia sp.]HOM21195.1 FAD-binding oxidoreductase [Ottowia sp.]HON29961.1 FAD-binding oxidoreductase [Ottowia sp.]HPP96625.1 FAD-binding oxidoreductase [Ottowia sp.]